MATLIKPVHGAPPTKRARTIVAWIAWDVITGRSVSKGFYRGLSRRALCVNIVQFQDGVVARADSDQTRS